MGRTTSRVVPGKVVDSSATSWPLPSAVPTLLAAATTCEMSGSPVFERGRGHADSHRVALAEAGRVGGGGQGAAPDQRRHRASVDVLHMAPSGLDGIDHSIVDIESEDTDAAPGRLHRQRQAYVPQSDDAEGGLPTPQPLQPLVEASHRSQCLRAVTPGPSS